MESKESGKAENAFKGFGKKVDQFVAELNEAGEKLQHEFREKYEDLKKTAERVKKETQSEERWKEVEASLRKAGDELANAFRAAFTKRDEKK